MINLFLKTLRDKRFFILGWSLGLLILSYSVTILFPSFSGEIADELAKSIPAAMQGFVGELAYLKQVDTYLGSQIFEINVPLFTFVLAILLAVGLTVGEESKGQLRTLIALPISRRSVIAAKWLAMAVICAIASFAVAVGVYVGLLQIGETIDTVTLWSLVAMLGLLTLAVATIVFGIGLATGSRALTLTIGVIAAAGSYLLTTFAQGVAALKDFEWLSILYYFPAPEIAAGTFDVNNIFVYLGLIAVFLVAAFIFFPRRDVKS